MPEEKDMETEARARSFWSGTIAFGLVSVPVVLFPANRSKTPGLRMVDEEGTPLRREYYCPREEKLLRRDEIVRGYEIEKDRYVIVNDDELASLEPDKSREIDLTRFVPTRDINPVYFERSYYLAPDGSSSKAYRLLAAVMENKGRAGIATFVMHAREYMVAIISEKGILRAETLRFADEIRSPQDAGLPALEEPQQEPAENMIKEIRKRTRKSLDFNMLKDPYAENLNRLIQKKAEQGSVVRKGKTPDETEENGEVIDLMEVMKHKFGQSGTGGSAGRPAPDSNQSGTAGNLASRSKSQLYEHARKIGIEGRSRMTKKELIQSIRDAR